MILEANFEPKADRYGEVVERGEIHTSEGALATRWGWTKSRVHRFLERLVSESQIESQTNRRRTKIRIVNYEMYQGDTSDLIQIVNQKPNHRRTTERTQHKKIKNKEERISLSFLEVRPDVWLTQAQIDSLKAELGEAQFAYLLAEMETYAANHQRKWGEYKDHNLVMRDWHRRKGEKGLYWIEAEGRYAPRHTARPNGSGQPFKTKQEYIQAGNNATVQKWIDLDPPKQLPLATPKAIEVKR